MKTKTFFRVAILATLLFCVQKASADTIDYWHIYYNDVKIKEFNQYSSEEIKEITLNINNAKKTDTLIVRYFRDVHYFDCETKVEIEDGFDFLVTKGVGIGIGEPIKIPIFNLLSTTKESPFFVYYYDCATKKILLPLKYKFLLFRINLKS